MKGSQTASAPMLLTAHAAGYTVNHPWCSCYMSLPETLTVVTGSCRVPCQTTAS